MSGGLTFVDPEATNSSSGLGLLHPPESIPSETDTDEVPNPAPEAKRLRFLSPEGSEERFLSMKMPKVVRTYTKKIKRGSIARKDDASLFMTQASTSEAALCDGLSSSLDVLTRRLASGEHAEIELAKKGIAAVSHQRKRQTLQEEEEIRQPGKDDASLMTIRRKEKGKRKKRRAPLNELPLVMRSSWYRASAGEAQVRASFEHHFF